MSAPIYYDTEKGMVYDDSYLFHSGLSLLNKEHKLAKAVYDQNGLEYHNWNHVKKMLTLIPKELIDMKIVNLSLLVDAIVWHDAVYIPGDPRNEESSAELYGMLGKESQQLGGGSWVKSLIMATKDHSLNLETSPVMASPNALIQHELIIDLDLYGLSAPWEEYIQTGAKIRQEFKKYRNEEFIEGRKKFIAKFLERDFIYLSGFFSDKESAARHNLERELYIIDRLGRLPYEG